MKLWVDDIRPAPEGYVWCKSVNETISKIKYFEAVRSGEEFDKNCLILNRSTLSIKLIDIDHDAGDFAFDGGDYIKLLDWLEENGYNYPIHIHSMNPVGVENMRRIIRRNGWKEI